jgi:hypothetical protein
METSVFCRLAFGAFVERQRASLESGHAPGAGAARVEPPHFLAAFSFFFACFSLMLSFGLLVDAGLFCPFAIGSLLRGERRSRLRAKILVFPTS